MEVIIEKSKPCGCFIAPPSKSYAHRLLIGASLSGEKASVYKIAKSEDMLATLDCIKSLGIAYKYSNGKVEFEKANDSVKSSVFPCRESGSTLRFFIPIALARGGVSEFTGAERLISRGISVYENICKEQGISVKYTDTSITFEGKLKPSEFNIRGDISSQFISGLFFALPMLNGDSKVIITTELESRPYVDITIDCLKKFGIEIVETSKNTFFVKGNQKYEKCSLRVEGDYSNSAFLDAFGVLGAPVSVKGLEPQSYQGDKIYKELFKKIKERYVEADISSCPDLAPILFALSGVMHGGKFTGTKRLKIKESDRAKAMAQELKKFGIRLDVYENQVIVHKSDYHKPTEPLNSHNDHRIVMALSVISTLTGAKIIDAGAVKKSFPTFFDVIKKHGVLVKKYGVK